MASIHEHAPLFFWKRENETWFDFRQAPVGYRPENSDDTVARLRLLGGPNKEEAREIILRLTGKPAQE